MLLTLGAGTGYSYLAHYVHSGLIGASRAVKNGSNATVSSWEAEPFGNNSPTGTYAFNLLSDQASLGQHTVSSKALVLLP